MPLAKITFATPADPARRDLASRAVHRAIVDALGVPEKDLFQILRDADAAEVRYDSEYMLEGRRDADFVILEITLSLGRTLELKRNLYRAVVDNLVAALGITPSNVFVTLYEVAKENFSFGEGRAQLADLPWPPLPAAPASP